MTISGLSSHCSKLKNHSLLSILIERECRLVCPKFEILSVNAGENVRSFKSLIFPLTCVFALSCSTDDGDSIPLALIGREGVVGTHYLFSDKQMPCAITTIISGTALKIDFEVFSKTIGLESEFAKCLKIYNQYLFLSVAQSSHCNQRHNIQKRICRLILQLLNHTNSLSVGITHELLAFVLGVKREVVTTSMIKLRQLGVIDYSRGSIRVADRQLVERNSCSCEIKSKDHFEYFFNTSVGVAQTFCNPLTEEIAT